jgi:ssDNA thymidine ADP-ribosyltransferase DarT-like protein
VTSIYHITHVRNLSGILAAGGLHCDRAVVEFEVGATSLAHAHIKMRRAKKVVPNCRGGSLADYVPFYFGPRSPMLYSISRGGVEGYNEGQDPVLHLETSAEAVAEAGLPFTFTNGHAVVVFSEFFDDLDQLGMVDHQLMNERYWFDTVDDPDRKRRRQAEFLVHDFAPWSLFSRIGVRSPAMRQRVLSLLDGVDDEPEVTVNGNWYY